MINTLIFYKFYRKKYNLKLNLFFSMILINFLTLYFYDFRTHLTISILLIGSIIDIKTKTIPNIIPVLITILSLKFSLPTILIGDLLTIGILFIFLIISLNSKYIGMGDVKLFFSVYFFKGYQFFNNFLFLLSILMFIFSIYLLIIGKKINKTYPLVPLILIAYLLAEGIV